MDWKEFRATYAPDRPLVIAHRGVPGAYPENTLASFRAALAQGADALETDLRFTRDGQIVCFHDPTLERMTDGTGLVGDRSLEELRCLRTRYPGDRALSDERIPTLLEVIALTEARVPLLLELKDPLFCQPAYARILADLLAATGMSDSAALVSFHFEHVLGVRRVAPEIPIGFITIGRVLPKREAQLLGPFWPLLYLNPLYVALGHRQGSIVAPLDPAPERRLRWYLRLGVDALLADNPATVRAALAAALAGAEVG